MASGATGSGGREILVIGAGIVGMGCACCLQRAGFEVTVVDRLAPGAATSYGNAGGVATGEIIPLSVPGLLREVPGWLLDPLGPLAVRWRYLPQALPWLLRFLRAGSKRRVRALAGALAALSHAARAPLEQLLAAAGLDDLLAREDCLYLYDNERQLAAERLHWELRRAHDIPFERVAGHALSELEPDLARDFAFGIRMPGWYHITNPHRLVTGLAEHFSRSGGRLLRAEVVGIETRDRRAQALRLADGGALSFDQLVIAAGAWSHLLARQLGDGVPLESHRGYHVTLPHPGIRPRRLVLYAPEHFVVTPMEMGLRVAGTVEIAGLEAPPDYARARILVRKAKRIYPALDDTGGSEWMGHRPATPDSLPVIGRARRFGNVSYAFGHGHLGLTFGPITGQLIAELAAGQPATIDLHPYRVDRF
jgi:glycine/D-amino acid oxidase-like deaminating enzyme